MRRRQVLAAAAGTGIGSLAGCLEDDCPPRSNAETPPDGWPVPGYNAANAGITADSTLGTDVDSPDEPKSLDRWRFDAWEYDDEIQGGATAPVVDDERVYFAYGHPSYGPDPEGGALFALEESTGELEWVYTFGTNASGAPALVGDGILVGDANGTFRRLERETGDLVWETDLESAVRTPVVADGRCYVQCADGRVVAVDVASGERCWTARYGGFLGRFIGGECETGGRPAITDDAVVVTTGVEGDPRDRTVVRVLERESGDERWELEIDDGLYGPPRSPVVDEGMIFVAVPNRLIAFDLEGEREWSFATGFRETSAPAVDGDTVYCNAKNAYAIDRESGEERWRHVNLAPDDSWQSSKRVPLVATPAVADGVIAAAFGALDAATGDHLWGDVGNDEDSDYFPGAIRGPPIPIEGPAITNGALYATTTSGRLVKVEP